MAGLVTTARLVCRNKEARDKVLNAFNKIVEYSRVNEPGIFRYVVTVPTDDTAKTDIYLIEEYESQAASDAHNATQPVQDLIKLLGSGEVLSQPPEVHNNNIVHNKVAREPPLLSSNPAIALAHFPYKPGTLAHALEGWKRVMDSIKQSEDGTLTYTVSEGKDELRTVEVYTSQEYWQNVHATSPAIPENQRHNGADRAGPRTDVWLTAVGGFFGKEQGVAKL